MKHTEENNSFIREMEGEFDGVLGEIEAEAYKDQIPSIPRETARLISVILSLKKPERILEIGTATGFSACLMSKFLKPGGKITTIDRYQLMLSQARINFERMGVSDKIEILEGDAAEILPALSGPYDVIFLDAAKGQYSRFLPDILRLLAPGGVLIADDIFQGGYVAASRFAVPRRQRTIHKRMRAFLWEICSDPALETSLVPIGDGIALCHKKEEN